MNYYLFKLKLWLRLLVLYVIRGSLHCFHLFPIDYKKIVFLSSSGRNYHCSPYFVYQYLKNNFPCEYKFYWCSKTLSREGLADTDHLLKIGSLSYIYHMLTAGVIITNNSLQAILPFKHQQLIINTWHGGGLFKKVQLPQKAGRFYAEHLNKLHNQSYTLFLASSEAFATQAVRKTFGYKGEIFKCGMPRNDIFFTDSSAVIDKVRIQYRIPKDDGIVLYAPTLRGNILENKHNWFKDNAFDIPKLLWGLEKKFHKKFHLMFRAHIGIEETTEGFECINVSSYREMQELLVAADCFITDYSSSLWDYSLTFKPCFIYAPDIVDYAKFPGFETDPYGWPFPIATNNEDLIQIIRDFDPNSYRMKVLDYHRQYGSFEKGNATEQVVCLIRDRLKYVNNDI